MAKSIYRDDQCDITDPLALDAVSAAKLIGISDKTLRALAKAKRVPHKWIGNRLVFPVAELRTWLADPTPVESPLASSNELSRGNNHG